MQIDRLTISNFRGIKGHFEIEPNGENVVLVGPNGSGKSSVIAAIDFLLTGTIQDLSGEGTQALTEKQHGSHVDVNFEQSWVEGVFSTGEATLRARRELSDRSNLAIDTDSGGLQKRFNSVADSADRGLHLLSRSELLDFITAKDGTRSERIRTLLNLQHVRSRRLTLKNSAVALSDKANQREREANSRRNELYTTLGLDTEQHSSISSRIDELRKLLGGDNLTSPQDFLCGIDSPSQRVIASPLLGSDGRQLIAEFQAWFDEGITEFLESDSKYRKTWEAIEADEQTKQALKRQHLIELGLDAVDLKATQCPLCLESWEPKRLENHLQERLNQASELQETLEKLESKRDTAQQLLTDIRLTAESLQEVLSGINRFDESGLEAFISTVSSWEDQYDGDVLSQPPKHELSNSNRRDLLRAGEVEKLLPDLQAHIQEGPQLDELDTAWQTLIAADSRYKEMIERSYCAAEYRRVANDMETVHQTFINARDNILDNVYSDIEAQFEQYYTSLHGDESDLSIGLNPTETGLNLEVDFHERGQYPPHALHSEGHQDSMGICLYFALCDWLQAQEEFPIIMLDDIVMSIDAEHRRPLAQLLASDLTDNYQLFIATHDDLWHRHLRSAGVVSSNGAVQFSGWNIEEGPLRLDQPEMEWNTIKSHLDDGNISIAAHQTRRMAEWFLREACDNLEAKVPFKSNSQWTLGDFKNGVISQYKKLIKDSKNAEQSWGRNITELEQLEDQVTDITMRIDQDGSALNPNIHWNEDNHKFAHCTAEELRPAVEAYRHFYELLWCNDCGSCLYLTKEGMENSSVRCNCTKTDLNLKSK